MFYVYVLQNPKGVLYKGQTDNILNRVQQHNANDGFPAYTKHRGPWTLVYSEECKTRQEAVTREKFLKSGKGRAHLKVVLAKHKV